MNLEKLRAPEGHGPNCTPGPLTLIVVAAFGQILRQDVLNLPRFGCINIHGSILPRWRGAAPIQAAILAGDTETGITIMKMDPAWIPAPCSASAISQSPRTIPPERYLKSLPPLARTCCSKPCRLISPVALSQQPQTEAGVSYAPLLKKEDGLLDFNTRLPLLWSVGYGHSAPAGNFFNWQGTPLKVLRARLSDEKSPLRTRFVVDGHPAIGTAQGILVLEEIQPAGKKPMPGKAFLAGRRDW